MLAFLSYSSPDIDERRRGNLFNIFLFGVLIPILGLLGINLYETLTQAYPEALTFFLLDWVWLGCLILLWFLHRLRPRLVRHLFLLFLALATVSLFEIRGLDRVLVTLTIPVLMAAFLIRPAISFLYAAVVSLAYSVVVFRSFIAGEWGDYTFSQVYNIPSVLSFFVIAFIAWLVSSSLDRALAKSQQRAEELRILNEELDKRVQDRTRELARALEREHTTAVRNQIILESIGDGVLVTDNNGRIIIANPAANRLAQRYVEDLALQDALSDVQPDILARIKGHMAEEAEGERPNIQFGWNKRTVAANIAPITLYSPGQVHISVGSVMVLRDVTREAELDRMKTIFLGSVSHELRTPMTAIKGYVDLLSELEADSLSGAGRKYLEIVSTNIKRLLRLASDLIDMSRIEVGELSLYREWVHIEPLVESAVDTVRKEFEKRGLGLQVQIDPNLPPLYLDRHRIVQVLLNLLTNA